jgi:hypothetical protein
MKQRHKRLRHTRLSPGSTKRYSERLQNKTETVNWRSCSNCERQDYCRTLPNLPDCKEKRRLKENIK